MNALLVSWNRFAQIYNLWSYNLTPEKDGNKRLYDCRKLFEIVDFLTLSTL